MGVKESRQWKGYSQRSTFVQTSLFDIDVMGMKPTRVRLKNFQPFFADSNCSELVDSNFGNVERGRVLSYHKYGLKHTGEAAKTLKFTLVVLVINPSWDIHLMGWPVMTAEVYWVEMV